MSICIFSKVRVAYQLGQGVTYTELLLGPEATLKSPSIAIVAHFLPPLRHIAYTPPKLVLSSSYYTSCYVGVGCHCGVSGYRKMVLKVLSWK
jgi:hypothetical protein